MQANTSSASLNSLIQYPQLVTGIYCFEDGEFIVFQSGKTKVSFKASPDLFRKVIPLLDGRHTCDQIVEEVQSDVVLKLISRLQEAKLIRNSLDDISQAYHQASSWEFNTAPLIANRDIIAELHRNVYLQQTADEADQDSITLPDGTGLLQAPFLDVLEARKSTRKFKDNAGFSKEQLSAILFAAAGKTHSRIAPEEVYPLNLRTYPSGGGLFPITLYLLVFAVNGLEAGLYRYNGANKLHLVKPGDFREELGPHFVRPGIAHANIVMLLTANFEQTQTKYGLRGYRFAFLEAGHLAQNYCLAAAALKIGASPIGGFSDAAVNKFLGLDGIKKACIYSAVLGQFETDDQT